MRARYFDPITIGQIASEVFVSPFHFSRVFAKTIGVTPGHYLTAVRLFEAKRLLLTTQLTVADVVCSVGYSSVGTFTSRFTRAVGMTPTQYRSPEVRRLLVATASDFHHVPSVAALRAADSRCVERVPGTGTITGTIELPPAAVPATVLVGVFADRIPQCGPVAYTALTNTGSARLEIPNVPPGRWTVIAVSERTARRGAEVHVGTLQQPVAVTPGGATRVALRMRDLHPTDPPIAITLASDIAPQRGSNDVTRRAALRVAA